MDLGLIVAIVKKLVNRFFNSDVDQKIYDRVDETMKSTIVDLKVDDNGYYIISQPDEE